MGGEASDSEALRRSPGEPAMFGVVYERHMPAVRGYLRRRTGEGPADDLTAEVFVRAFRHRSAYEARLDTALPWLLGIASNVIGDHRRLERRRLATLERLAAEADRRSGQDASRDLSPELARALRRLPAADRDALLLVCWGELSYQETAVALDVPIGTVRSRIARARSRLRGAGLPRSLPVEVPATGETHA
jgi:RNA polymerase sigma-70 factor (ECF subfamily)